MHENDASARQKHKNAWLVFITNDCIVPSQDQETSWAIRCMQRTRFSHTRPSFIIIASTRDSSTPSFRLAIDSRFSRRRRRIAAAGYYRFALFPLSDHFLDLAFFFGRSPPSTLCFFRIQKQKATLTPPPKKSDTLVG